MKTGLSIKNKENKRNIEKLASEDIQQYCGFNLLNEHFETKPP